MGYRQDGCNHRRRPSKRHRPVFLHEDAVVGLAGAILLEQKDERCTGAARWDWKPSDRSAMIPSFPWLLNEAADVHVHTGVPR